MRAVTCVAFPGGLGVHLNFRGTVPHTVCPSPPPFAGISSAGARQQGLVPAGFSERHGLPQACAAASRTSSSPCTCLRSCLFKRRHARLDIFNLHRLRRVIQDAVRRPVSPTHVNKANSLAVRRLWFTTPPRSASYACKELANLRSLAGLRSAEPRSVASWPKRDPDSGRLTQPCRKDTKFHQFPDSVLKLQVICPLGRRCRSYQKRIYRTATTVSKDCETPRPVDRVHDLPTRDGRSTTPALSSDLLVTSGSPR